MKTDAERLAALESKVAELRISQAEQRRALRDVVVGGLCLLLLGPVGYEYVLVGVGVLALVHATRWFMGQRHRRRTAGQLAGR